MATTKRVVIWIDLEVTDFDSTRGALTQLSCIVERNGEESDRLNIYMNPFDLKNREVNVSEYNLERSNRTIEEVKTYPKYQNQFNLFVRFLAKNLKEDELFQIAGHNVANHDLHFIKQFFINNGLALDFKKYFSCETLDTLHLAKHLRHWGRLEGCENDKLGTLCKFFGVKLENWHNSMEDIEATRELYEKMYFCIQGKKND